MFRHTTPRRAAFSLTELLVVVGIVLILLGLLLPAIHRIRLASARLQSANNLKEMGIAFQLYHDSNGVLPNGSQRTLPGVLVCASNRQGWSWAYQILPYLKQETLYRADTQTIDTTAVKTYYAPTRRFVDPQGVIAKIDFAGNAGTGLNGILVEPSYGSIRFKDIVDGTSSTLMLGEKQLNLQQLGRSDDDRDPYSRGGWNDSFQTHRMADASPARDSANVDCVAAHRAFGSPLGSGFNCVFADGAVHHIRYGVDLITWRRVCVRNDSESSLRVVPE